MSHARIEEVSDSDDGGSDPSEGDIDDLDDDFDERDILKQRSAPAPRPSPATAKASQIKPSSIPSSGNVPIQNQIGVDDARYQKYKDFQCIYPVYFDKNRSRGEGRRVGTKGAVENPLALEIVNACQRMGLETLFEPTKIHPKDWANPGRVKVKVKGGNKLGIKHKHHLYTLISKHLLANPSTVATAKSVNAPGFALPDASKPYPTPAVPKGWKISSLLPSYSPALSGGGVSDDIMKDMLAGMGGGQPGMPDMSALAAMMGGGAAGPSAPGGSPAIEQKEKKEKKPKRKIIRG